VIVLAVTVCAIVWTTVIGFFLIELVHPAADTTAGLLAAWDVAALMLGAVAGYLLGRRTSR
jgi:hypothetical protein